MTKTAGKSSKRKLANTIVESLVTRISTSHYGGASPTPPFDLGFSVYTPTFNDPDIILNQR